MIRISEAIAVSDSSAVAAARRASAQFSVSLRLDETAAGKASLVVTELATNLVKHAGGGSLLFGSDQANGLTITSIDKGGGIPNIGTAMSDGYSTAGSPGTGLGAIERLASSFAIYSPDGRGSVIHCVIAGEAARPSAVPRRASFSIAGICIPKPGEEVSGDDWVAVESGSRLTLAVLDGLGHGPLAATASAGAVRVIASRPELSIEDLMWESHAAIRPTRGAAAGIARVAGQRLEFTGVGNIAGAILTENHVRRVVSGNGIVGHEMRRVSSFSYSWSDASVLVLQSDGVSSNWGVNGYPGLLQQEAPIIAAVIYRDYCRGNDDATVVVAKPT